MCTKTLYICTLTNVTPIFLCSNQCFLSGHILSRIYNCTKQGNRPIDKATTAHLDITTAQNCDQLYVKICPASFGSLALSLLVLLKEDLLKLEETSSAFFNLAFVKYVKHFQKHEYLWFFDVRRKSGLIVRPNNYGWNLCSSWRCT